MEVYTLKPIATLGNDTPKIVQFSGTPKTPTFGRGPACWEGSQSDGFRVYTSI